MRISKRVIEMQESPIRKLTPYADAAKEKGKTVYHLNIGQPDVETPEEFYKPIREFDGVLTYSNSLGNKELLDSFVEYYSRYNIKFKSDEIIVTFGGTEALIFAMLATCDVGDEILVPEPLYTSYNGLASMTSINIVPILTKAEDGFHLPAASEIEKLITPKTRAILVSNPCNPTGRVYTKEEVYMLADIAKKHDIYIFADEVYREFVYDDAELISFAQIEGIEDRVILIDSISKRYSACGARIGSIATKNKDLYKELIKLAQGRICTPLLEQIGAANLINVPEEYIKKSRIEYGARRDIVYEALKNMDGVVCEKPSGAFYFLAKLPIDDSEKFILWLLKDFDIDGETVMLAPAADFYASKGLGKNEVRISYCINQESLKKAMNILDHALKEYPGRV